MIAVWVKGLLEISQSLMLGRMQVTVLRKRLMKIGK
jgi:hypothetical protein